MGESCIIELGTYCIANQQTAAETRYAFCLQEKFAQKHASLLPQIAAMAQNAIRDLDTQVRAKS